jgi:hypothetical protein
MVLLPDNPNADRGIDMSRSPRLGVVQFQHPGPERIVDSSGWTPWNTEERHRRKFIQVNGRYLTDQAAKEQTGSLTCWTEWEPPSQRLVKLPKKAELPQSVVCPVFPGPAPIEGKRQNTDPYIFGDRFLYTYCQQAGSSRWNSTELSHLSAGTLILFGSHLGGRFVLDTAFVVSDWITHSRNTWRQEVSGAVSSVYEAVTLEPMYSDPIPAHVQFRLYRGATADDPINETFSFFPCLPTDGGTPIGFARPTIYLDGIINPRLTQNRKTTELDHAAIAEVWSEVVRQVQAQGLMLGVAAEEPQSAS